MKKLITLLAVISILNINAQQYTKLFDFNGTNGAHPAGSLMSDGTYLYGMTYGGVSDSGLIYKIKPDGTGYQRLFYFNEISGINPDGSLISDGIYLYGVTSEGGINGGGTIFKIKPDGTGFQKIFDFNGANGI